MQQHYTYGEIVADRMRELRREAALAALGRPPRVSWRRRIGSLMIRAGQRLVVGTESIAPVAGKATLAK